MHHDEFHRRARLAGLDLRYPPDTQERFRQIRQMILIFQWMVEEQEKESLRKKDARPGEETVNSNALQQPRR